MSFELAIQSAVYEKLSADVALSEFVSGIYDQVPSEVDFPYVTIGEGVHTEFDTASTSGCDATISLHSWSRYKGRKEIKQIQGAIYDALHNSPLEYDGFIFRGVTWVSSQSFIDADGLTRHGEQTFRIFVDKL